MRKKPRLRPLPRGATHTHHSAPAAHAQYKGLTPNMTRRAQCANWLLYYREELFGYTVEELRERRRATREAEERAAAAAAEEGRPEEWKLPVKEVY